MERARFDTVMALFEEILEHPVEERAAQLARRCGGDRDLRKQVEALLDQAEADDDFLEANRPGDVLREHLDSLGGEAAATDPEAGIPDRIGHYRILGVLGRGGMGVVYEAEQDNPRRRVALKILRTPFLTEQLRTRFERESEILGRLRHPGIAHVYEAGITGALGGEPVPFYAMELVEGISLTRFAGDHGLDVEQRLALMIKICDAVEHAHGHGVVHRDLKPDNILVDQRGEPRILDFGVARIVGQELQAHSMATATGLLIGTLPYMSPEQVGPRPDEVDARSDVYALGVIAFELLAGTLPIDVATVSIPEAARRIREVDARRLSRIDRKYSGDVATIVEKALEKEPRHRYPSAAELSRDIQRHLADEPILARPQSSVYYFRKFARRHKAVVGGALIALGALLVGTVVATRQAVIANKQRATAVRLQHAAERQAYRARVVAAATAIEGGDIVLGRSHLEAAPETLRGWEWRHLHSRLDLSSLAIESGSRRHSELRFGNDENHLAILDKTNLPWTVSVFDLTGNAAEPVQRFPVGMSRPLSAPPKAAWLATLGTYFTRGESRVELQDPAGGPARVLRRCDDGSRNSALRSLAADGRHALQSFNLGSPSTHSEVQLCDLYTGQGAAEFLIPYGWAFAMSEDGSTIAVTPKVPASNRVDVFRTGDGKPLGVFAAPVDDVTALDLSRDNRWLVAGSFNGMLRVWNVETGRLLAQRRGHDGHYIDVVRFDDDTTRIASGSSDHTVHLWPFDLARQPVVLHGHADLVTDVRFSPDGNRLASIDRGGWMRLWNLDEPLVEPEVLRGHGAYVNPVRYSPDGRWIASGSWDGTVKLWDAATGKELRTFDLKPGAGREFGVTGLAFDRTGSRLAAVTTHVGMFVFDLDSARLLGSVDPDKRLSLVEFSPDGDTLYVGSSWEDLLLVDARTLEVIGREPFGVPFAWSPDGTRLLLRESETSLMVRESRSGSILVRLESLDEDSHVAEWSPDGLLIVTASPFGEVKLWDAGSGKLLGTLGAATGTVHTARFHPDGTRIVVAGTDGVIRLFDTRTREGVVQLRGHEAYVYDVAWSPDGATLASASGDSTVRLWHSVPLRERNARHPR